MILALALGVRVAAVQAEHYSPTGDARSYLSLSGQIAQTGDYARTDPGAGGSIGPTAYLPPGYPYLLGAIDWLDGNAPSGANEVHVARITQAVIGTIVVGLTGLIALELFGAELALVSLALAAIYPAFVALSTVLVAETQMVAFELAAVWCALRAHRARDTLPWVAGCGVCVGLGTLTHLNAILLLIPLAVGVGQALPVFGRRELSGVAVLVAVTLLTLSPWLIRDGIVLHRFVPVTDQAGITLAGTYNPQSASAQDPPDRWLYFERIHADRDLRRIAPGLTEPALDTKLENRALSYIADHPSAPLVVGWHNTLRLLELEGTHAWRASTAAIGVPGWLGRLGVIGFWILGVAGLIGLVSRPAWRAPAWVWAVPLVMWLSIALINAETPRSRSALDPFLILLAARGLGNLTSHVRRRGRFVLRRPGMIPGR